MTDIRQILIDEMKATFGTDDKRIRHALAVLDCAEQINQTHNADQLTITAAAILHDIGIQQAEKTHGSNAGKYQEIEGPPIAEAILKKHNIPADTTDLVCRIIANHHSAKHKPTTATKEFQVIWDADWLINFNDVYPNINQQKTNTLVNAIFKTPKGIQLAKQLFSE